MATNLLKLFVIIGNDRGSREDNSVTFSGSIFFRGFIGCEVPAGPAAATGIEPMRICGMKPIGVGLKPEPDEVEPERWRPLGSGGSGRGKDVSIFCTGWIFAESVSRVAHDGMSM